MVVVSLSFSHAVRFCAIAGPIVLTKMPDAQAIAANSVLAFIRDFSFDYCQHCLNALTAITEKHGSSQTEDEILECVSIHVTKCTQRQTAESENI